MAKRTAKNTTGTTEKKPRTARKPTPARLVEEIEWTDEDEAAADRAMAELYGATQTPPTASSSSTIPQ